MTTATEIERPARAACDCRRDEEPSVLERHPRWVYWGVLGLRATKGAGK